MLRAKGIILSGFYVEMPSVYWLVVEIFYVKDYVESCGI